MKAITVHRPWDFAILELGKDIENRSWAPPQTFPAGSTLAIHAGKKWDSQGAAWIRSHLALWIPPEEEHPTGIVGVVQYDGTVRASASKWFAGKVGWQLSKAQPIDAIACKGKQRLWNVPQNIEEQILEAMNPPRRLASEELLELCGQRSERIGGAIGLALKFESEALYHKGDATDLWEHYQMLQAGPSPELHPLYTYGHQGGHPQQLTRLVAQYGACVLDIRHKAATGTTWHSEALKRESFPYHHVRSLGNKNNGSGPLELNDPKKGLSFVCEMLRWQPVILLCKCKEVEGCHRQQVSDMVKEVASCTVKHIGQKKKYEANQLRLAA